MKSFNDLSDKQQQNVFWFLDKTSRHELNKFKIKFQTKMGRTLVDSRNNILDDLRLEMIDFEFFIKWLGHIHLDEYNTLYVFEPKDVKFFQECNNQKFIQSLEKKTIDIYDVNTENLKDVVLLDVDKTEKQLLFTLAAPSFLAEQNEIERQPVYKKDIYLAYLFIDFINEQVVLSMHPTVNLFSLCGIRKKRDFNDIALHLMNFFRREIVDFDFSEPEWIVKALYDMVYEYYDHNNPIINKKMLEFEEEQLSKLLKVLFEKEERFKKGNRSKRLKKSLRDLYELQLINVYGVVEKETPFEIFLNESGKGITSFRANARGKSLDFADSYEIVTKMVENADISSIGIIYNHGVGKYAYKLVKESHYFSLKRITTGITEKEIVDNVLRQLKKYKPREEVEDTRTEATDN